MSCSQYKNFENMKSSATIIQVLSTKVVSKDIRNVDFVENDFTGMMNCTHTAETSMRSAISVIGEITGENSNTMSITIP